MPERQRRPSIPKNLLENGDLDRLTDFLVRKWQLSKADAKKEAQRMIQNYSRGR